MSQLPDLMPAPVLPGTDEAQPTALEQLDAANAYLAKAPLIHVDMPCFVQDAVLINIVTPSVTMEEQGFHHAKQFLPARVLLRVAQDAGVPAYVGTGTATIVGNATLFDDSSCQRSLAMPLSLAALTQGIPAYVKGKAPGQVTVRLVLTPSPDSHIHVTPEATDTVTISPVNVVTPSVKVENAQGFHHAEQFQAAHVTLRIEQSRGVPAYGLTGTASAAGATLFADPDCLQALAQPLSAEALGNGVAAYVKGAAAGNVTVRLALADPNDLRLRVAPEASGGVKFRPVNVVTPSVVVADKGEGFHHAAYFKAVQVTLRIAESTRVPLYAGSGTATTNVPGATFYSDAKCTQPLVQPLEAPALGKGVQAWVKGGEIGDVVVSLALSDPADPGIRVGADASGAIKFMPVNVVTPSVTVDDGEGFHHKQQFKAASVTVRIAQSEGAPKYRGNGTLTATPNNATLFEDEECKRPFKGGLGVDRLSKGVKVHVKGGAAGQVTVGLSLDNSKDPAILVLPKATGTVAITPVNVITPVITGDELALVHDGLLTPWSTTLSELQVSFEESHPARTCPDLSVKVTYGSQVACFEDAAATTAFASPSTLARARMNVPVPLHIRGVTQGNCTVTAVAQGASDPAWRFAEPVVKVVRVDRLKLDAYRFRDALVRGVAPVQLAVGGPPKRRELHECDGDHFTFARFVMRKPDDAFWKKASRITLTAGAGLGIYADADTNDDLSEFVKSDFAAGDVDFWVRTTVGARALTNEPPGSLDWVAWGAHADEKEPVDRRISCGATIGDSGKELAFGDLVALDTFSLDRALDRHVRNACGALVQPVADVPVPDKHEVAAMPDGPQKVRLNRALDFQRRSALSLAQAHRYFDNRSAPHVNKYYRADNTSPFKAFVTYLNKSNDAGHAATRGANFVENHLRDEYGVSLAPSMKGRIKAYMGTVLVAGWGQANCGFAKLYGLPGTHAECLAANELMLAGIAEGGITVATYMLQNQPGGNNRRGKRFVACPNCSGILSAPFRVITG